MVDKTKQVDPGKLTAYERWELPNIGVEKPGSKRLTTSQRDRLKPPTADDLEQIRKQAYDSGMQEGRQAGREQGLTEGRAKGKEEGYQVGYSQGLEEGLAAGQTQINESLVNLESLLSELIAPLNKQQNILEEAMLNVSMAVARAVIHRELSIDSSSIREALHLTLNELPKVDKGFSIRVHPKDEAFVSPILERHKAEMILKTDDSILPGGFELSSSSQLIDHTIEKRFQKTVQSMLSAAIQGGADADQIEVPSTIAALSDYSSDTLNQIVEDEVITDADKATKVTESSEISEHTEEVMDEVAEPVGDLSETVDEADAADDSEKAVAVPEVELNDEAAELEAMPESVESKQGEPELDKLEIDELSPVKDEPNLDDQVEDEHDDK